MDKKFKVKTELDFCRIIDVVNSIILVNLYVHYALSSYGLNLTSVFLVISLIFFTIFKYYSLKNIHYALWPLLLINLVISTFLLIYYHDNNFYLFQALISIIFLFFEMKIISSPIFFPIVRWWEYDFRYRTDLKVKVIIGNDEVNGRIIDVRRKNIGLTLFRQYPENTFVKIVHNDKLELLGQIVTKREPNPGRGFFYGIRLNNDGNYTDLKKVWDHRKMRNLRKRFIHD